MKDMPELIHSITAHLRQFVGNRRDSARHKVQREAHLLFRASLLSAKPGAAAGASRSLTLEGQTRDISATGLALILPATHIEESHLTGENPLQITLELPGGPVLIHGKAVRYDRLNNSEAGAGALVCVLITGMSNRDRTFFNKYLKRLRFQAREVAPLLLLLTVEQSSTRPPLTRRLAVTSAYFWEVIGEWGRIRRMIRA